MSRLHNYAALQARRAAVSRPTATQNHFPFRDHRTVEQVDATHRGQAGEGAGEARKENTVVHRSASK